MMACLCSSAVYDKCLAANEIDYNDSLKSTPEHVSWGPTRSASTPRCVIVALTEAWLCNTVGTPAGGCRLEEAKPFVYRGCSLNEQATSKEPEFGSSRACSLIDTVCLKSERSRFFDCSLKYDGGLRSGAHLDRSPGGSQCFGCSLCHYRGLCLGCTRSWIVSTLRITPLHIEVRACYHILRAIRLSLPCLPMIFFEHTCHSFCQCHRSLLHQSTNCHRFRSDAEDVTAAAYSDDDVNCCLLLSITGSQVDRA